MLCIGFTLQELVEFWDFHKPSDLATRVQSFVEYVTRQSHDKRVQNKSMGSFKVSICLNAMLWIGVR